MVARGKRTLRQLPCVLHVVEALRRKDHARGVDNADAYVRPVYLLLREHHGGAAISLRARGCPSGGVPGLLARMCQCSVRREQTAAAAWRADPNGCPETEVEHIADVSNA